MGLTQNIPAIKRFITKQGLIGPTNTGQRRLPSLTKIDITRDIGGSLHGGENWRFMLEQLCVQLENQFGIEFKDNGNLFDTCFQCVGQ